MSKYSNRRLETNHSDVYTPTPPTNLPKVIVTGTGRAGTHFAASFLFHNGLPCGHEELFGPYGPYPGWKGYEADSGWMAVPFIKDEWCASVPVIHVVRHPYKVIKSYIELGFFEEKPKGHEKILSWPLLPDIATQTSRVRRAAYFWLGWNRLLLESVGCRKYMVFLTGKQNHREMLDFLGISSNVDHIKSHEKWVNYRDDIKKKVGVKFTENIHEELKQWDHRDEFYEMAQTLGYESSDPDYKL